MQSTGVLNLSIGLTDVKEKRGAHMSYMSLARTAGFSSSSVFTRFLPTPVAAARPHSHRRSLHAPPTQAAATRSLRHRRSRFARARPRRSRAPRAARVRHRPHLQLATAAACHSAPPPRTLSRRSHTSRRPRSSACTPFTPQPQPLSARRVLDELPEPLFALLSRHVCVPALPHHDLATASRDGS